jgi:nucleoside-diphosphate-sugar epimerase
MEALVTGAGGFLGGAIAEQLVARGDYVRAFSRRPHPHLHALGVESIQGDVRDAAAVENACRGMEVVFHVAGVAGIWGPWKDYYEINTLGTKNVLIACRKTDVRRMVYTSSPSVTFSAGDQLGIDESVPYPRRWLCHYPHSKALAERMALEANGKEGLLTCALRPHLIWGPRDMHLIPRLLERARLGKLVRVGDGTNRIDMVYVENAARAHLQAADALRPGAAVCGRPYFISQGQPVNCWTWIGEILSMAGLPPLRRSIPFRLAWWIGAVLELKHYLLFRGGEPRMTRFLAAQLARSHFFDIRRAQQDFGYVVRVSTAEGMKRLAEWLAVERGLQRGAARE